MNSNVKTTSVLAKPEFWVTLVTSVSGLLLAFGVITPEQAKGVEAYAPNIIGGLLSLLSTTKFISAQTATRVEVFRALCAMRLEARTQGAPVSAQSLAANDNDILHAARAVGL